MKLFSTTLFGLYTHQRLHLVIVFVLCWNAFVQAQEFQNTPCDLDSLKILNGQIAIYLPQGVYKKARTKKLESQFTSLCSDKLLVSDGFDIGKNAGIYFYQTDIDFPMNEDYGLAIWELIHPIVAKIPNGVWAESGWRYLNGHKNLYSVRISTEKRNYLFGFFNIEGKLSFSLAQSELPDLNFDTALASTANNWQLTKTESHRPRYDPRH